MEKKIQTLTRRKRERLRRPWKMKQKSRKTLSLPAESVRASRNPQPQPPAEAVKQEDEDSKDVLTALPSEEDKVAEHKDGELGTIADISEDEDDVVHKRRLSQSVSLRDSFTSEPETALTQKIRRLNAEEVVLPPEPRGRCSKKLQDKIAKYYRKNLDMNASIQSRKDFRNPSIYEKLISYLGIDELGTNYPKDVFNPHGWDESSYYESLARAQKEEMAKREREKKEKDKTKVEFVSGVVKKPPRPADQLSILPDEERKRKSKWDAPAPNPSISLLGRPQVAIITTSITNPMVVSTTVSSTGAKTTVISAIGTIKKPKIEKTEK
ncbi:putative SAP30-binding protein isoform X1 [Apostichopus japonicus]|uniref:Putative SAP30-binding protein isoform X1 n=1 Tax=Stichopus japonicus TaxID=307972 RepID=A0A2G8LQ41_STIJA|nr:putative SAP30-binding protein isoform X1 [Apostichopus japonicus]